MRTTIELPDELLAKVEACANAQGISPERFMKEAVEQRLTQEDRPIRKPLPVIVGNADSPAIGVLTAEQIEDAAFGPVEDYIRIARGK